MAETKARSCPGGSGSVAKSPPASVTRGRTPAAPRRTRAISTTGGRSNSVAVIPGFARRNASVYVPEAPPTSRSRREEPSPTAATIRSACGAATTCIAPMNAARNSGPAAPAPGTTFRVSSDHLFQRFAACRTIGRTEPSAPSTRSGATEGSVRHLPPSFSSSPCAASASSSISSARGSAPVFDATSSSPSGSGARSVKRSSSAPVRRTRLSMKFRARARSESGVCGVIGRATRKVYRGARLPTPGMIIVNHCGRPPGGQTFRGGTLMILGIGTDLLDVARMAKELEEKGAGFRNTVFTPCEIAYCEAKRYPARHFAARFAAKEALFKALAGSTSRDFWREVEVARTGDAPPRLLLHGCVKEAADRLGVKSILVSLSHTDSLAAASVVLQG